VVKSDREGRGNGGWRQQRQRQGDAGSCRRLWRNTDAIVEWHAT